MTDRAYTVAEIDALRSACELRWLWGTTALMAGGGCSRSYKYEEKVSGTEQLVRTYMLAGITADAIYAEDRDRADKQARQEASRQEAQRGNLTDRLASFDRDMAKVRSPSPPQL